MTDNSQTATPTGTLAVISYVTILLSFLYCGYRSMPLVKANFAFFGACIVSLGLMVAFADILIRWTRTGRAMSFASAFGAALLVAFVAFLHFRG